MISGIRANLAQSFGLSALVVLVWLLGSSAVLANASLDGRVFTGMIGPVENPDLADSLHFDDGHFWSDICTRCGFVPGEYTAELTDEGIRFHGVLASDSRGTFTYDGLVREDGTMNVSIQWERRRWYWTSRREIAFRGAEAEGDDPPDLSHILVEMGEMDPESNPLCARF